MPPPLSKAVKAAFAVGGVGGQICGTIAAFFLSPWLLQVVMLQPRWVGVILLTGESRAASHRDAAS